VLGRAAAPTIAAAARAEGFDPRSRPAFEPIAEDESGRAAAASPPAPEESPFDQEAPAPAELEARAA
jgi:hypothetical protein